jgi:hypothetical protein
MEGGGTMSGGSERRITLPRGEPFTISFEGEPVTAWSGESVGAALIAGGHLVLRYAEDGSPRGLLCGVGTCWECRCVVNGRPNTRACMVEASPGMAVARQKGLE